MGSLSSAFSSFLMVLLHSQTLPQIVQRQPGRGGGPPAAPLGLSPADRSLLPHAQRQRRNKTVACQTDATELIDLRVLQQQLFDVRQELSSVSSELAHAERRLRHEVREEMEEKVAKFEQRTMEKVAFLRQRQESTMSTVRKASKAHLESAKVHVEYRIRSEHEALRAAEERVLERLRADVEQKSLLIAGCTQRNGPRSRTPHPPHAAASACARLSCGTLTEVARRALHDRLPSLQTCVRIKSSGKSATTCELRACQRLCRSGAVVGMKRAKERLSWRRSSRPATQPSARFASSSRACSTVACQPSKAAAMRPRPWAHHDQCHLCSPRTRGAHHPQHGPQSGEATVSASVVSRTTGLAYTCTPTSCAPLSVTIHEPSRAASAPRDPGPSSEARGGSRGSGTIPSFSRGSGTIPSFSRGSGTIPRASPEARETPR